MRLDAAYIASDEAAPAMSRGINASQRARGVEAWAVLASLGRSGLAELVDTSVALAKRIGNALETGGADLLAPVVLNQVLVAFGDDATTRAVIDRVQRDGIIWAGGTVWKGRAAMRVSVSDFATTRDDADAAAAAILAAARAVGA
jgi:glutamate/tyrosine decarboxylase-like PLP-dependent enzyme